MKARTLKDSAKDKLAKEDFINSSLKPKAQSKNKGRRVLNVRIEENLIKEMRLYCAREESSFKDFVNEAIKERLERVNR